MKTLKLLAMITLAAISVAVLSACKEDDFQQPMNADGTLTNTSRYTVNRVAIFRDKLAYEGKRGIYVITDTKTGKEMLGISGIGINELGSHSSGKTSTTDER